MRRVIDYIQRAYLAETPALEAIYRFKQRLRYCLLEKGMNQERCQKLTRRFLAQSLWGIDT
jgi:hypothetical protein